MCRTLRHPNIVPLIGVAIEVGSILLIMEYIDGKSLDKILFVECLDVSLVQHMFCEYHVLHYIQLSESIKVKIAMDIAQGLNYMHTHDPAVIHQDIKPANIMVSIN